MSVETGAQAAEAASSSDRFFGQVDPERMIEAVALADIAYSNGSALSGRLTSLGQTALTAADLGLAASFFDAEGYFVNENAMGFAAVEGNTLTLSFTGSNFPDIADLTDAVFDQPGYYALLQPLIDASLAYAASDPTITKIEAVGQSLGGAMAARFAAVDGPAALASLEVSAISFASPGTDVVSTVEPAISVQEVAHSGDPIVNDIPLSKNGESKVVDLPTVADSPDILELAFRFLFGLPNEHDRAEYQATVNAIAGSPLYDATTPTTAVTRLGDGNDTFVDSNSVAQSMILGLAGDDFLIGDAGEDLIDGGDGDDVIVSLDGNDRLFGGAGMDILLGGLGEDVLLASEGTDVLVGGDDFAGASDNASDTFLYLSAGPVLELDYVVGMDTGDPTLGGDVIDVQQVFADAAAPQLFRTVEDGNTIVSVVDGMDIEVAIVVVGLTDVTALDDNILS